jgi:hypothetical protein
MLIWLLRKLVCTATLEIRHWIDISISALKKKGTMMIYVTIQAFQNNES